MILKFSDWIAGQGPKEQDIIVVCWMLKLADRVRYFKEDEKGVKAMSGIIEELIDDEKRESALRMLEDGKLSNQEIAKYLKLDIKVVEELEKEQKAVVC